MVFWMFGSSSVKAGQVVVSGLGYLAVGLTVPETL
jgi:hypothetical protein